MLSVLDQAYNNHHFWALALYKDTEYSRAKIPMLPVIKGQRKTKQQILVYSLLLFLVSLSPYYLGFSGIIYFYSSAILSAYFVYLAYKIFSSNDKNKTIYAPKLFKFSILYLYLLFLILVIDKYV